MFKDKINIRAYFQSQLEAILLITLQIFLVARAVLKIGKYSRIFSSFNWGISGHVTRLDQSRAGENF